MSTSTPQALGGPYEVDLFHINVGAGDSTLVLVINSIHLAHTYEDEDEPTLALTTAQMVELVRLFRDAADRYDQDPSHELGPRLRAHANHLLQLIHQHESDSEDERAAHWDGHSADGVVQYQPAAPELRHSTSSSELLSTGR